MKKTGQDDSVTRVVAIDGPAASGKSTTARMLAKRLGWLYMDTGAMYRAITFKVLREKVPLDDASAIGRLAETSTVDLIPSSNGTRVFLDREDITRLIRTPEVDRAIGPVCEVPRVREIMVGLQRSLAEGKSVVAEGRDMGTMVFPGAGHKFFMTASVEERAARRKKDLEKQGLSVSLEELKAEIERRDRRDITRRHSPLARAEDAVLVDTSDLTAEEQVQFIIERMGVE
jgi:CMP/dCMP kinase